MKATKPDVSSLLFPAAYRRQVLALLLLHPERKLHVREISRLTGTTAGTMNKELTRLHQAGLLERERVGNQVHYSANRAHQVYSELASILRKTVGMADVLVDALAPLADSIELAFIYGSVARGTESTGSDVDLVVVGKASFGSVVEVLHGVEKKLGREVNPKVYSLNDWKLRVKAGNPFVTEILKGPKIMLVGAEDGLGKARRN